MVLSHCAVYADAGYLLAAAATRVTGTSLRGGIEVNHAGLIEALTSHATESSGLPLLRVHWYDSARHAVPDQTQQQIGLLPRVKLRLGRVGVDGGQKGVDIKLGLDLVLRAPQTVDSLFLISGDDDLTEAVEEAQAHGLMVTVLAVPTPEGRPHGISQHLQTAADGLELLSPQALDATITPRILHKPAAQPTPQAPSPALLAQRAKPTAGARPPEPPREEPDRQLVYTSSAGTSTQITPEISMTNEELTTRIDRVVSRVLTIWLEGADTDRMAELHDSRPSIPQEIDRALLRDLSDAVGIYELSDVLRHRLRARFWHEVDNAETS